MKPVSITCIEQHRPADESWLGYLDSPAAIGEQDRRSLAVAGWVVCRTSPARRLSVLWRGIEIASTLIDLPRPDVIAVFPDVSSATTSGYRIDVNLLGIAGKFELTLKVDLDEGAPLTIGLIEGQVQPIHADYTPLIQPLLLSTTVGRTGSTWLMQLLSAHPDIVVHPQYPYEVGAFRYWMHMAATLSLLADHEQSAHPFQFSTETNWVGRNPYDAPHLNRSDRMSGWFGQTYFDELIAFCQRSAEGYYDQVALSLGKPTPRYFAEKFWEDSTLLPNLTWQVYPQAAEVFLIRDLRDMFCSVRAFNAKRGYLAFGYDDRTTDADYMRYLRSHVQSWIANWKLRQATGFFVHYETLVQEPEITLQQLFDYLKLDSTPQIVADVLSRASAPQADLTAHRTTSDARSSIGRWRRDLTDDQKALCQAELGDLLVELGYDLD